MNLEKYAEFQKPQIAVLSGIPFAWRKFRQSFSILQNDFQFIILKSYLLHTNFLYFHHD